MKSQFRDGDTVGTQYIEAQKADTSGVFVGDVNSGMVDSLIEDINKSIESDPFDGRPFFINVVEQRDLLMKNAFKRRMIKSLPRPYPECNTLVFHVEPKSNEVLYCWDIPHHSEFFNILSDQYLYDHEYVSNIRAWMRNDMTPFGFIKVSMSSAQVEGYEEKTINAYRQAYYDFCKVKGMDDKDLEIEKKIGFFWIPNKFHEDKEMKRKFSLIV